MMNMEDFEEIDPISAIYKIDYASVNLISDAEHRTICLYCMKARNLTYIPFSKDFAAPET